LKYLDLFKISEVIVYVVLFLNITSCTKTKEEGSNLIDSRLNQILKVVEDPSIKQENKQVYLNEALVLIKSQNDDSLKIKYLSKIAGRYINVDFDKFYSINKEISALSIKANDSISLANSLYNVGYYYNQKGRLDSAFNYYSDAKRVYEQLKMDFDVGDAGLAMAVIQKNARDYIGSESNSIKAIRRFETSDNLKYLTSAYNNLGIVSRGLNNYDKAIEYYEKAIEYRIKQRKNRIINAGSYNNIGLVYMDKKEYDKAIDFFNRGLSYDSLFIKRPKTYARLLDNLAYARFLSGENADYPPLFEKPLKIRDSIDDQLGLATNNLHIATYYYRNGLQDAANNYARIALDISKSIPYNRGVLESLELLTEVNEPEQALKFSKERIRISDSLQEEQRRFQDQSARIRYESEELEEENTKVTQRLKWSINSILGLLVLGLAGYIIIQRRIALRELNHNLRRTP